jgi:hypothetical protein
MYVRSCHKKRKQTNEKKVTSLPNLQHRHISQSRELLRNKSCQLVRVETPVRRVKKNATESAKHTNIQNVDLDNTRDKKERTQTRLLTRVLSRQKIQTDEHKSTSYRNLQIVGQSGHDRKLLWNGSR